MARRRRKPKQDQVSLPRGAKVFSSDDPVQEEPDSDDPRIFFPDWAPVDDCDYVDGEGLTEEQRNELEGFPAQGPAARYTRRTIGSTSWSGGELVRPR